MEEMNEVNATLSLTENLYYHWTTVCDYANSVPSPVWAIVTPVALYLLTTLYRRVRARGDARTQLYRAVDKALKRHTWGVEQKSNVPDMTVLRGPMFNLEFSSTGLHTIQGTTDPNRANLVPVLHEKHKAKLLKNARQVKQGILTAAVAAAKTAADQKAESQANAVLSNLKL